MNTFETSPSTSIERYRACIASFHNKSGDAFFFNDSQPKDLKEMTTHLLSFLQHQKDLAKKSGCLPPRYVHRCHEPPCGGLGDRIKGAILSFYMSLFWGFSLEFRWDYPSQISDFFVTANSDILSLDTPADLNAESDFKIFSYIDQFDASFYEQTDFGTAWNFTTVESRTNADMWHIVKKNRHIHFSQFPYIQRLDKLEMANIAMQLLLQPNSYLIREMQNYTNEIAGFDEMFKIGIQLRTGDASMIKNYDGQAPVRHSADCGFLFAQEALKLCLRKPARQCLFFITSDSEDATVTIKETISKSLSNDTFFILETQGQAAHIDKVSLDANVKETREYYLKTYLDWAFLTKMDALVISRSGFGETAAWASMARALVFVQDKANLTNSVFVDYLERVRTEVIPVLDGQ